jgi:hypothetical protein
MKEILKSQFDQLSKGKVVLTAEQFTVFSDNLEKSTANKVRTEGFIVKDDYYNTHKTLFIVDIEKSVLEDYDLEKGGKRAAIGEIRTWGGVKHMKTSNGWEVVKDTSKQSASSDTSKLDIYRKQIETLKKEREKIISEATDEQWERDNSHPARKVNTIDRKLVELDDMVEAERKRLNLPSFDSERDLAMAKYNRKQADFHKDKLVEAKLKGDTEAEEKHREKYNFHNERASLVPESSEKQSETETSTTSVNIDNWSEKDVMDFIDVNDFNSYDRYKSSLGDEAVSEGKFNELKNSSVKTLISEHREMSEDDFDKKLEKLKKQGFKVRKIPSTEEMSWAIYSEPKQEETPKDKSKETDIHTSLNNIIGKNNMDVVKEGDELHIVSSVRGDDHTYLAINPKDKTFEDIDGVPDEADTGRGMDDDEDVSREGSSGAYSGVRQAYNNIVKELKSQGYKEA